MITDFIQKARNKFDELKNDVQKFRSKEFLHAALGGSALVILADGEVTADEKKKMIAFIENHEALKVYDTSEVLKVWKDYMGTLELDADVGEAKVMTALGKIKGKKDQARLILRMVCSIGAVDGNFDEDEKRVAAKIAREVGLDPKEFELC